MSDVFEAGRRVIAAIAAGLERRRAEEGVDEVLGRLAAQNVAGPVRIVRATLLPACRHLSAALGAASEDGQLFSRAAQVLAWRQNPNYSDGAMNQPGYMDNYAYAEIVGPSGPFAGDDFLLGLLILGPNLFYPDHFHPAQELYWALSGPSEWRVGGGTFKLRAAGATIWHPPHTVHAMRTGSTPLVAVWAWTGDVDTPARLVGS